MPRSDVTQIHPTSRAVWRAWLTANHDSAQGVRLVLERAAKLTRFRRMSWLRLWYGTAWGG